jgi:hypothetical protein
MKKTEETTAIELGDEVTIDMESKYFKWRTLRCTSDGNPPPAWRSEKPTLVHNIKDGMAHISCWVPIDVLNKQ